MKKIKLNSYTKLKLPWPSNKFGSRRIKKNFEFSNKVEAALAQQQVWNQKNDTKTLNSQTKTKQPCLSNKFGTRRMKMKTRPWMHYKAAPS
jgi:hypothetical protein